MTCIHNRWWSVGVAAVASGAMASASAVAQCVPQETAKLLASNGGEGDSLGAAVSISGNTALVGASRGNGFSGTAYLYENAAGVWTEVAQLVASDGAVGDEFGTAVSISGDVAVVGAHLHQNDGFTVGAAYVFEKIGGVWTQAAELLASDGEDRDNFGISVSTSGTAIIVGAHTDDDLGLSSGSAYVFEKAGGAWTQVAKLLASDGAGGDAFGIRVSIEGDTAVVGARKSDSNGIDFGAAYVFDRIAGVWTESARLVASDGASDDAFGNAVTQSGDTVVVGAWKDDDLGAESGSAYVFEKVGGAWTQAAKLHASDGAAGNGFAWSASISGDALIFGAFADGVTGSAYVFEKTGGVWTQTAKLLASDGAADDSFGWSVSLSGAAAIVGALGDDDRGMDSGSAYVFDLDCNAPQLSVITSCPSAGPIQVSWSGATGGGTIALLYARNTGSFHIPNGNPCAGTALGLGSNQLQIGYQGSAGPDGSRTVNSNAGAGICGGYLQLLDAATCATSNLVSVE